MHYVTDPKEFAVRCAWATCFADLVEVAKEELGKFSGNACMVCGPISSGGRGSVTENLRVMDVTIEALRKQGMEIFSQTPYEDKMNEFKIAWIAQDSSREGQYFMPILEEFYRPLFRAGLIAAGYFIPGWESSFGASWERKEFLDLGVQVIDLKPETIDTFLMFADPVTVSK